MSEKSELAVTRILEGNLGVHMNGRSLPGEPPGCTRPDPLLHALRLRRTVVRRAVQGADARRLQRVCGRSRRRRPKLLPKCGPQTRARSLYAGAMIRHIVMFGVDADNDTDRNAKITEAAVRLEKLVGVVPGLRSMTVGANGVDIEGNYDFALVADLDDADALGVYANHPAHLEVSSFIGSFKTARAAIDIEL